MTPGFSFANLAWLPPVLPLWAAAVVLAFLSHRRLPASRLGLLLRLAGLTILALALLEPTWSSPRARPGANHFAILADDSRSLQLPDGNGRPRGEALRAALSTDRPWQRALGETYQLKRYRFDARLERVPDFGALAFSGSASHLGSALRALADRWKGAPLAGVLLFSDGNATDLEELARLNTSPAGLPPIYPVVPAATTGALRDSAVAEVTASETLFEDAPVHVDARIEALGLGGKPLVVELRDETDQLVETRTLTPGSDEQLDVVRFRVKPAAKATPSEGEPARYKVSVSSSGAEVTSANNSRHVLVPRPRGAARLLYVGGRPSWEYKFLRRALEKDRVLELAALVRIAPREPKFAFLTRKGEATNPLYRGFGASASDAERFDEAVLQRLGTRDAEELRGGFPSAPEPLFEFSGLILDDLEAGFFTAAQQALVDRFVTERGGGLLMLGGIASFRNGGYARTPIGDLLPVYLDRRTSPATTPAQMRLSQEGWLEGWTRLRDNEAAERTRLAGMPPFLVASATQGVKPGATVLATLAGGKDEIPALVVQRAGEGRVAALTVGDLWRWGLHHAPEEADDLGKFWRQTLRALVADVPRAVTVTLEAQPGEAGALAVRARVLGRDFRPADAKVEAEVVAAGGARTRLALAPAPSAPGAYEGVFRPQATATHADQVFQMVHVRATAPDGRPLGEASAGRVMDLEADEHRSLRPNRVALEALARQTGGAVTTLEGLDQLVRQMKDRPAPVSDLERRPLWSSWLIWLLALACLAAEWTLRRRRGLP